MRLGRSLKKRIQIWRTNSVPDGYGGFTVDEEFVSQIWAKVNTINPFSLKNIEALGLTDPNSILKLTIRKPTYQIDVRYNFIVYRGHKYNIITTPVEENMDNAYVIFYIQLIPLKTGVVPPEDECTHSVGGKDGYLYQYMEKWKADCPIFRNN